MSNPPLIPYDLLQQFGEPLGVFGPKRRIRFITVVFGMIFLAVGALFFVMWLGVGDVKLPLIGLVAFVVGMPLIVLGLVMLLWTWIISQNWLFICPRGLVRKLAYEWEGIGWIEIERVENATVSHKNVTVPQGRIVLKNGKEWGFSSETTADYDRLIGELQQKLGERAMEPAG